MNHLIIKNIGPIKSVDFELNKVNVFMGPQSSGKSTIAKIISYCQWVEKRFLLDGSFKYNFIERFMDFHRIDENYFSSNSFFQYESKFIKISYKRKNNKENIEEKSKNNTYKKSKNIYIPAERNFVAVIPNLGKYKETNDNIMSFLYDWYDTKKNYAKKEALPILNLGINYHHIEDGDSDILTLRNNKKEIALKNASSGLQSIVPLTMLVDYLTNGFYKEESKNSVVERDFLSESFIAELTQRRNNNEDIDSIDVEKIIIRLANKILYHYSNFIIEEPEQNLFPSTQRDLMYFILNRINKDERNHILTLTTHSPYILYALNNCMLGYKVKDTIDADAKEELLCKDAWINPDLVSVWEIKDGEIKSIINKETGTVSKHYFNQIMNEVMDEYYEMLNYLEV